MEKLVVFQTGGQRVLQDFADFADYLQNLTKELYKAGVLCDPVKFNENLETYIESKGQVQGKLQVIYSNMDGDETI